MDGFVLESSLLSGPPIICTQIPLDPSHTFEHYMYLYLDLFVFSIFICICICVMRPRNKKGHLCLSLADLDSAQTKVKRSQFVTDANLDMWPGKLG